MNMAKLLITLFALLLTSSLSETKPVLKEANHKPFNSLDQETISVFEPGTLSTVLDNVQSSPPKPLLIARPTVAGTYPVLIFLHGTCLENYFYSDILQHIASHGYIVVAPQLYSCLRWLINILPISGPDELNFAAEVANWLISGLENVLPENITGDINKLAIAGHSRGGKMAFALALGYAKTPLTVTISALIGLDPVEGTENMVVDPKVLTYIPNSFNLSVPVAVIGSGLGNESSCWLICPACAPNGMNHVEYYSECKNPVSHFVTTDYGHMDVIDDGLKDKLLGIMANVMCKNSKDSRDPMRRTVGGIFVAFLKAYLFGESGDYMTILQDPSVAPVTLDPVQFKMQHQNHAQV